MELAFKQHSGGLSVKFGGRWSVYGQVLVVALHMYGQVWWWSFSQWSAVKFGDHIQQQTQEPPQEELLVVMSMSSVVLMVVRLRWLCECMA